MSILSFLLNKLARLFLGLFGGFRRALCCFRRRRRSSGTLPITLNKSPYAGRQDKENSELQSWEAWDEDEAPISIHIDSNHISNSSSQLQGSTMHDLQDMWTKAESEMTQAELDYFKDMVPEIRRPKKVLIRQQAEESSASQAISNRLALDTKAPIVLSPELGVIDDVGGSWEDAAASEDLWDTEEVLREKRKLEKERKLAEHQRRKQEREGRKSTRFEATFSATKLS